MCYETHQLVFFYILVYSFDGLLVFSLLMICTCAYLKRIPRLKQWMFSEKKGFLGIFYKGSFCYYTVVALVSTCLLYFAIPALCNVWVRLGLGLELFSIVDVADL